MRYITTDETWFHHYIPESNRQSAEWTAKGEICPKRLKTQMAAGKVLASVFWDAHSILFIDYLKKGRTINSEYYTRCVPKKRDFFKIAIYSGAIF